MKFNTVLSSLLTISCCACSDPSEIGSNFFTDGSLNLIYTDTITVRTSTVLLDSLVTGTATRLLIGHHLDEDLGPLTCEAYFNLGPDNDFSLEDVNTTYLRLSLILSYDNYSYYDTAAMQTFFVYRLTEDIEAADDGNIYNTSTVAHEASPLGQLSFTPYPNRLDSIEIPLTDELGRQFYDLSKSSSSVILNSEDFQDLLRGVVVKSDTSINGPVIGFSPNAELRLYYEDRSSQPTEEKYLSYSIGGSSSTTKYFNSIRGDRSKTLLAGLTTRRHSVGSSITNDRFYLQGGNGLVIRIETPYIRSILQDDENLILSEAFLRIKPVHNSYRMNCALPEGLTVYNVNGRNEILSEYGTAQLVKDEYLDRDSYYFLDIKTYVKQQISIDEFNNYALMLKISDEELASSVTRLYAGDVHSDNELEVSLHVVTVDVED